MIDPEDRRRGPFDLDAADVALQVRDADPDVVFLCSPNNPTGTALDPAVVTAVLDVAPGMVVVDEAYAEFARPGTVSALSLLPGHPRLVVTRTMSKAFGFAGGRLGYLAADPAVVEAMQLVRLPYHLSALTQAAARAVLANAGLLLATVDATVGEQKVGIPECDEAIEILTAQTNDPDDNFVTKAVKQTALNQFREQLKKSLEDSKTDKKQVAGFCRDFKNNLEKSAANSK